MRLHTASKPSSLFSSFSLFLIFLFSFYILTSCAQSPARMDEEKPDIQAAQTETQDAVAPNPFPSFRDVPGITAEEIAAIETLQRYYDYFIFGAIPSSEAFIRENTEVGGFTALFCEYLTELFGISFQPQILPFNRLLVEFNSLIIDFTGTLTATPERLQNYFMTDPIAEFIPASMATANPMLAPIISVMDKALQNGARSYVDYLYGLGYEELEIERYRSQLPEEK